MFDIGAMELFVVATLALVVVGPKELPKLLRTVSGFIRRMRELAADFRSGVEDLAAEVEKEVDPFADLRKQEGLRPGMSPEEITAHILANREEENSIASPEQKASAGQAAMQQQSDPKDTNSGKKSTENSIKNADSDKSPSQNGPASKNGPTSKNKSSPQKKKAAGTTAVKNKKTGKGTTA